MTEFSRRVDVFVFKEEPLDRQQFFGLPQNYRKDVDDLAAEYRLYVDRHQAYRWHAKSTGNHEVIAHGESYFNLEDCLNAVNLLCGDDTTAYVMPMFGEDRAEKVLRFGATDRKSQSTDLNPPF